MKSCASVRCMQPDVHYAGCRCWKLYHEAMSSQQKGKVRGQQKGTVQLQMRPERHMLQKLLGMLTSCLGRKVRTWSTAAWQGLPGLSMVIPCHVCWYAKAACTMCKMCKIFYSF